MKKCVLLLLLLCLVVGIPGCREQTASPSPDTLPPEPSTVETLPERAAEASGEDIVGYVSHLEEKYRLPILLKYGENLPEKDIAAILRIPRGTVSSRINRALAMLRKELEKEESGHA